MVPLHRTRKVSGALPSNLRTASSCSINPWNHLCKDESEVVRVEGAGARDRERDRERKR